jgi:hypothetical protein
MTQDSRAWTPDVTARFVVDTTPWLSCDDCFHLVDSYVEALLRDPDAAMVAMDAHLRCCSASEEQAVSLFELAAADAGVDATSALHHLAELTR